MKVIVPIELTGSMITYSSVSEPDVGEPALWDPLASYTYDIDSVPTGDRVIYAGKIYETLRVLSQSLNSRYTPLESTRKRVPRWVEVGSSNKMAMFDQFKSSATTFYGGTGTVTVTPGSTFDSIAVLYSTGVSQITVGVYSESDDVLRYSATYYVDFREQTTSWYSYFFQAFQPSKPLVITDLPTIYGNTYVTLTLTGIGEMSIGTLVLGSINNIGNLIRGASSGLLNFSTVERDTFGTSIMIPRRSVPVLSGNVYIDKSNVDTLITLKETLNARPGLWIGVNNSTDPFYEMFLVYGIYRQFSIEIDNPIGPIVSVELEEL